MMWGARRCRFVPVAWAGVAMLVVAGQGCGVASARPPLDNAEGSAEALAQTALTAFAERDEAALEDLLVTRSEYEELLWPEMPDGRYTPFDFVWSLAATNNRKGLREAVEAYGGMHLEVVSVTFTEEPEVYESFTLHPGAEVRVRDSKSGQEGVLPSFDVFVEYGKTWKLMNFDEL